MWVEMDMDHQLIGHAIMGNRGGQGTVVPVCKVSLVKYVNVHTDTHIQTQAHTLHSREHKLGKAAGTGQAELVYPRGTMQPSSICTERVSK